MQRESIVSFQQIPPAHLYAVWESVGPLLDLALKECVELKSDDLYKLALTGSVQIWTGCINGKVVAAFATEVVNYPRVRRLRIIAQAGKVQHIRRAHFKQLLHWAHLIGCKELEGYATGESVMRLNRRIGFKVAYYFMTMPVEQKL